MTRRWTNAVAHDPIRPGARPEPSGNSPFADRAAVVPRRPRGRSPWRWAVTLICLTSWLGTGLVGCAGRGLRGPGFDDELGEVGRAARPQATRRGEAWGFSTKAREVERDLGIE